MTEFKLTPKQQEANELLASSARHIMLAGGSRSGKTFLLVRAMVIRALKAPHSRHAPAATTSSTTTRPSAAACSV